MKIDSCEPQREVPIIHVHSYQDPNVLYDGGVGSGPTNRYDPPLDSVLNAWGTKNGCSIIADTVHDSGGYDHVRWEDCSCSKGISLLITHDGGHTWPGGNGWPGSDPVSTAIDANERIWSFFQKNPYPCNASSVQKHSEQGVDIELAPNPVGEELRIKASERMSTFRVLDASGSVVIYEKGMSAKRRSLSVSELDGGVYFLQITDVEGRRVVRKFWKEAH